MKYAGADFLAAVSGDLAAEVRAQVPDLDVECIPNGCDVTSLRQLMREPAPHCPPDHGGILITAMGRLARQKGFDVLIRALAILRREVDAQLVIIGSGSSTQLAGLTRLAAKQGVAGHVHFAGYLANPFALIARSQMFVCASRWEGSCNALLEALACEVPVVATDCPTGNAEMLLGGQLGELALPGSAASLADAMHRELQTQRSAAGRERQLARLDIARCLEQWTALLAREYHLAGVRGAQPQRA